jgi:very-short-patch-repair endonuclease
LAAVLACGDRAVASHRAAAAHIGLMPRGRAPIDVTVATGAGQSRTGIRAHRGKLLRRDVLVKDGIRCTSVARTILDVADYLDLRGLERVVDQAEVQRLLNRRAMEDVLARAGGRRGVAKVRAVLAIEDEPAFTKSYMEELFLAMCRDHGLPRPVTNGDVEDELVDFHWPDYLLIVETDSKRWHGTTRRREKDNARDRRLQLAEWRVLRFSWRSIALGPAAVAAEIRAFLTAPAALRIAS